jgi:hypothetical protein
VLLGHKAGQARAKLGQAVGRAHAVQAGRAGADRWATKGFSPLAGSAQRGRGLHPAWPWAMCSLCRWAMAKDSARWHLICFSIFQIYLNPCKFKNLCRIHLNSKNYETIFVE